MTSSPWSRSPDFDPVSTTTPTPPPAPRLQAILDGLPRETMIAVVRPAFAPHLANVAEGPAPHPPPPGATTSLPAQKPRDSSRPYAGAHQGRRHTAPQTVKKVLDIALVSPVLTAHPTEVSRKSILQCQHEVARLLDRRDSHGADAGGNRERDLALRRTVLNLWRTRMPTPEPVCCRRRNPQRHQLLRRNLFRQLPRLHAQFEDQLAASCPREHDGLVAVLLFKIRLVDRRRPRRQPVCHR